MSQAEDLLNSLTDKEIVAYTTDSTIEDHIVIGSDRYITVPEALKRIAVQHDHNIETVTFDCPRYWDKIDMSRMKIYINYMLADGTLGCYLATNVIVDKADNDIMHFDWTLTRNVTSVIGALSFLICIKRTNNDGEEVNHWNSELCKDAYISEGLECVIPILKAHPDVLTQILTHMDVIENLQNDTNSMMRDVIKISTPEAMQNYTNTYFEANPLEVMDEFEKLCTFATDSEIDAIISETHVDDIGSTVIDEEYFATNSDIDKIVDGSYIDTGRDVWPVT